MRTTLSLESVGALVEGRHTNPGEVLGPHQIESADGKPAMAVRAFLPNSGQAWVFDVAHNVRRPMRRIHPAGLYEVICPMTDKANEPNQYRLQVADERGRVKEMHDPWAFEPLLTEYDMYLLGEGSVDQLYDKLGAQLRTVDGVVGVNFCVWAPNAQSVSLVGDFNGWDGRQHPMRKHVPNGFWEIFVPGIGAGEKYKYRVKGQWGEIVDKSDPMGFAAELPPHTASVVADLGSYQWKDTDYMERRAKRNALEQPTAIYEVHLGSWKKSGEGHGWMNYRDLAHQLVEYCQQQGYTHLELMPISEHPFTGSWGYQTVGYYAVTSRYGSPEDFMYFVDYCHQHDIGVIIDWVPAHFPKDGHGLRRFDGSALYEHEDPRQGEHPDWGTLIFNYGRNEVRNFLVSNALFWMDKYHIDGLRVDAVASMLYLDYSREDGQWIPNCYGGRENLEAISLLKQFNEKAHDQFPGVLTIAEESTAWGGVSRPTSVGGLGFSLKWNMGWMNDTLTYMRKEPIYRRHHQNDLTFSLIYAFTENFCLPLSHDEIVHGKRSLLDQMSGDLWQKFANLRLLYSYMWMHPGKKLLFMGGDFGQWHEWDVESELQWDLLKWDTHQGIQKLVADLNKFYKANPALYEVDFEYTGFEWIDCHRADDSTITFLRKAKKKDDYLLVHCNFTPVVRDEYWIGVPELCYYEEVFNSDSEYYGGTNVGTGGVMATEEPSNGRPYSIRIKTPPLGVSVFKPKREKS